MDIVKGILVVLHLIGFAMVFGGAVVQFVSARKGNAARILPLMVWGALLLLVTGLALVGMIYALGGQPNNIKIGVKLLVLLALTGHIFGVRKKERVSAGGFGAIAGMALLNAAIAVLWH